MRSTTASSTKAPPTSPRPPSATAPSSPPSEASPRCKIGRASCRERCRSLCDWSSDVCSSDLDEIYDRILYEGATHVPAATLGDGTLFATFGGLSKVHRACGIRCGWVFFTG